MTLPVRVFAPPAGEFWVDPAPAQVLGIQHHRGQRFLPAAWLKQPCESRRTPTDVAPSAHLRYIAPDALPRPGPHRVDGSDSSAPTMPPETQSAAIRLARRAPARQDHRPARLQVAVSFSNIEVYSTTRTWDQGLESVTSAGSAIDICPREQFQRTRPVRPICAPAPRGVDSRQLVPGPGRVR